MGDVSAYFRDLQSRAVNVLFGLEDRSWGMRDFRIEDPFGNRQTRVHEVLFMF
jgi:uncharacterized glyoxalase superfamily protein PhnB